MPRRENCWGSAPQESGHMKDELAGEPQGWMSFTEAGVSVDRWMESCGCGRCRRDLTKLPPDECDRCLTTGEYLDGMLPPWGK